MSKILIAIIGVVASGSLLAAWQFTQPTQGSGWLLFVAIISAISLAGLRNNIASAFAAAVLTAGFGFVWFIDRGIASDDGWNLFTAIICAISFFVSLSGLANGEAEKPDEEESD